MECLKCKCARYIFCCDCIPIPAELKGERYSHLLVLTLMATTIILFLSPAMEPFSRSLPCCYNNSTSVVEECEVSANTVVVMRLSFAFVIFHSLVFLLELYLKTDPERLSRMRRGFWCSKMTFIALMCYMCIFIKPRAFDEFWAVTLMLGANVFIVVQLYTLIRLAYLIVIMLQKKVDRGSKPAHQIQIALIISGILLSIISESLLILYYPFCSLNVICLITNAVIPSLACLWSVSDCVRARNGYSGFLHGSILCCFVQYWTWSAISSIPDSECSPYTYIHEPLSFLNVLGVIWTFIIYIINTNYTYEVYVDDVDESIPIQKEISENASESDREYFRLLNSVRLLILNT